MANEKPRVRRHLRSGNTGHQNARMQTTAPNLQLIGSNSQPHRRSRPPAHTSLPNRLFLPMHSHLCVLSRLDTNQSKHNDNYHKRIRPTNESTSSRTHTQFQSRVAFEKLALLLFRHLLVQSDPMEGDQSEQVAHVVQLVRTDSSGRTSLLGRLRAPFQSDHARC